MTRHPGSAGRELSLPKKIAFSAATLVLALGGLELGARAVFFVRALGKPPPPADPVFNRFHPLRYELRPGGEVPANGPIAHVNDLGLRGPEVSEPKRVARILCIGDSCTFGYAPDVTDAQTYPALLGQVLEADAPGGFEVINGGFPGFCSLDSLNFLQYKGVELRPDIVVVMVGWNDAKLCHPLDVQEESAPALLDASALVRLGRIVADRTRGARRFDAAATRAALRRLARPRDRLSFEVFERYERTVGEFVRFCRAWKAKPVLVTLPSFVRDDWTDVDSLTDRELELAAPYVAAGYLSPAGWNRFVRETNDRIERVAGGAGVPLVDGRPIANNALFVDLCHLNARGNLELARRVAAVIGHLGASGP
jgi:lysophospholipase L1-like esterase